MTAPTRTEFEAAALPPLPEPAYWETMGRVYKDKTEAERVAWLTSETAGKSRPVYGVYTAGQMHEFRRTAIAAHAAQTERERFEAAAYRSIRDHYCIVLLHEAFSDTAEHSNPRARLDEAMAAAMGWPTVPEQGDEVARLRAVVDAAQEWSADRPISDWSEADLLKALWTFNGDTIEPCPECDGECGEPCAPCTVAEAHAAIDATLDDLVKRGKLYRGDAILPPAPIPNFCGVCNKTRDPNCAKCGQWSAAPTVPEVKS